MLMRRKPLNPGKGFKSRCGWAGAGHRDDQDEGHHYEGHHYEPGQADSREQRLAERAARQIESALATASMVPGNVTMAPGAGTTGIVVPKEHAIESEPYRRLVAELPCFWCCISGCSQHAQPRATDVDEGIKQVCMLMPRYYFDATKTARLLECLKRYQRRIHTVTNEPMEPLHDEFSHGADCMRYVALWVPQMPGIPSANDDYQEADAPDWR